MRKRLAGLAVSKWHYRKSTINACHLDDAHSSGESATNNPVYYPQKKNGERIVAHYNHYRRIIGINQVEQLLKTMVLFLRCAVFILEDLMSKMVKHCIPIQEFFYL